MDGLRLLQRSSAVALLCVCAGCATWHSMDRQEKGTAAGATGGALAGAVVGGPVGAAVGAGIGGYAGHYETKPGGVAANVGKDDQREHAASVARDRDAAGRGATSAPARGNGTNAMTGDTALVRSVQQALNDKGFHAGTADGQWGPSTEEAVRQFQKANGLPQTGGLDQRTLATLGVNH